MFRIFSAVLFPLAAALFFFWRHFIRRALDLYGVTGKKRVVLLWVLPLALALAILGAFSAAGILYLHFFLLCALSGLFARFWKDGKAKRLLCTGLPALVVTLLVGVYAYVNMCTVVETDYAVTTEKTLSKSYTVVMVSDAHYGNALNTARLEKMCGRIGALEPDVLLLGGDIVDESTSAEEAEEIFRLLGSVKTAYGVYYVSGNHDKGTYRAGGGHDLEALTAGAGITFLRDEAVTLNEELLLIGRRDANDRARTPVEELLENTDEGLFTIVLDHQPKGFEENAAAGADLTLSGHTHAGQIFPAGFLTTVFGSDLNYGRKELDGMTAIVTSGCSGWGFPLRTSRHSEYVCVTVTQKNGTGS